MLQRRVLTGAVNVFKSLQGIRSNPTLLKQARLFSNDVANHHPDIGQIYSKLLNQPTNIPMPCNFISQVVDRWADTGDKTAIICVDPDKNISQITYPQLVKRSHQIANFFTEQGFKRGDSVALMLGQHPAWWYSVAGLMRAGIAVVPCPRLLTAKDLEYRINHLGIRGIITAPELQKSLDAIKNQCPTLETRVTTGAPEKGWFSLKKDVFSTIGTFPSKIVTTTEDLCIVLYSSGTTGQPKAVLHHADYPFFHYPTGRRWLLASPEDLIYNASDTGWGFLYWTTTAAWSMGAKILITPTNKKFSAAQMLATLQDNPVTIFCAAPTVLRLLVADPAFDQTKFPCLRRIVTVGEALDETVINKFVARGIEVAVGFGQAETPLLIGRVDDQPHIPGTMGCPIDPYNVVLLDENYQPLPPGSEGEGQIAVDLWSGATGGIMRGYAHDPDKTRSTRSPDGRYHLTGDWAFRRKDGSLVYLGRHDDLIKALGYRIGPDEVEKAGMSHPAVAKIAVVGVRTSPNSSATTVKAFILLHPGYTESPELIKEIQTHIKKETAPFKYPRLVECLSFEEWQKFETISGKIRRAGLRKREEEWLTKSHANESPPEPNLTPRL